MGERFLDASDPDDLAILERAAREAADQRERESKNQATYIAEAVNKVLGG